MHKTKQETVLKVLTPKQMLQRIPITLVQVKAGNNSENFSNCLFFVSIKKNTKKKLNQCNYKSGYHIYGL